MHSCWKKNNEFLYYELILLTSFQKNNLDAFTAQITHICMESSSYICF